MNLYFIIIFVVVLEFIWTQYLAHRNRKMMNPEIPSELEGIYDEQQYSRQQAYQKKNSKLGLYSSLLSFIILLFALILGGFGYLDTILRLYVSNEIGLTLAFFGVIFLVSEIISIPFGYYDTFVIEEEFGFNKSSKKTYWADQIKGLFVGVILGGFILALITWVFIQLGEYAWLYAWAVIAVFSVGMSVFYSNVIVPIFNKQTPLEGSELKDKISQFAQKVGFSLKNIYVIDASKRSTKANAYFTGLGAKKRIVLFDTLIKDLSTDEIVAVLAHEIGHYKKKHTLQGIILSLLSTGIILYILSLLLNSTELAIALGTTENSFHIGLIAFSILFTPVSILLGLITNNISRRNEYQADAFAIQYGLGDSLISGLKKLSVKSLSNLNPDKLCVFVNYSHPTLLERIKIIKQKEL